MFKSHHLMFGLLVLTTNAQAESDGIGSDTVKLVPNVSMGGEYRSNLYLDEGEAGGGRPVVQGTALLVNPTLGVKVQSNALNLRMGAGYGARKYVQSDLQNLNSFNDGRISMSGRLLPRSPIGLSFADSFSSNNRPVNQPKAESALIRVYDNKARAGLGLGSGNALSANIGGVFNYRQINGMRDAQGNRDIINQRNTYGAALNTEWKFLPKTALVLDGMYAVNDWDQNQIQTEDDVTNIDDSTSWDAKFGLEGQVSAKTLVRLMAGAGGSTYGDATATDAVKLEGLSQRLRLDAGFRIKPSENQDIRLEYKRAFQDVYFTNFNLYHQVGLTYEVSMMGKAVVSVNGQYRNDNYEGPVDRTDHRLQAGGGLAVNFSDRLALESTLNWRRLASADGIAGIEYDDVGLTFGLNWGY